MRLYHYTCGHSARRITRQGFLVPMTQPALSGARLVWLTDQEVPDRIALGLTSHLLDCDRLDFRYVVESADAQPWRQWLGSQHPLVQVRALARLHGDGLQPDRWFVSTRSVWAKQDRNYSRIIPECAHAD